MARAGLTAARLAEAGATLADELGFEQVTASALARHFGVQVASLYSHVRNTRDLRVRIATLALDDLADLSAAAVAGRSGHDALSALAGVYRDYARTHPGRYAAAQLRITPADTDAITAGRRNSALLRAVLRDYRLPEPDETHAVRLLGSTFHGYVDLWLSGGFDHSPPSPDETWTRIVASLDATFRSWSTPKQ